MLTGSFLCGTQTPKGIFFFSFFSRPKRYSNHCSGCQEVTVLQGTGQTYRAYNRSAIRSTVPSRGLTRLTNHADRLLLGLSKQGLTYFQPLRQVLLPSTARTYICSPTFTPPTRVYFCHRDWIVCFYTLAIPKSWQVAFDLGRAG